MFSIICHGPPWQSFSKTQVFRRAHAPGLGLDFGRFSQTRAARIKPTLSTKRHFWLASLHTTERSEGGVPFHQNIYIAEARAVATVGAGGSLSFTPKTFIFGKSITGSQS